MSFRVRDRVTPVNYTSYAVRTIPASCQPQKPASPVAAWYFFIFSTKHFHFVKMFCGKDLVSSALPEAISPTKRGIARSMVALAVSQCSLMS